jgi:hypothetical protein
LTGEATALSDVAALPALELTLVVDVDDEELLDAVCVEAGGGGGAVDGEIACTVDPDGEVVNVIASVVLVPAVTLAGSVYPVVA